jgi:FKBP-type peptidyl-prolyl cis-trans isomerase
MKRQFFTGASLLALTAVFCVASARAEEQQVQKVIPTTPAGQFAAASASDATQINMDDVSYCIGLSFGKSLRGQEIDVNLASFNEGIEAGVEGNESKLSIEQIRDVMNQFQTKLVQKQMAAEKKAAETALEKEKEFLKENKSKSGVSSTKSGLQYRVIKSGAGEQPASEDLVTVHYHGFLPDGTVFDSSYQRGEPVTFPLNRVIAGWSEALKLMKEGDKWELYIPSRLAYGAQGAGSEIGPNQTLVFEVELLKVQAKNSGPKAAAPGVS